MTGPEGRPPPAAFRVAGGILCSRVLGFARDATLAFFFGAGAHADVFATVLRGPNLLQNLLGEQTLSASFIPVYSRLLEEGEEREAGRFAGAVFGLLLATAAALVMIGVLLARPIVALLAPGYLADAARLAAGEIGVDRYELAVRAIRLIFPMTGVLVLSAWCLGVLNSHRRFFLPYFAPALWNAAIIGGLLVAAGRLGARAPGMLPGPALDRLLLAACAGALAGGLIQFFIQLPVVARVLRGFRLSFSTRVAGVRTALRAFGPLLLGRGVVQLSGYLDFFLASYLAAGAVGSLRYAQALYLLPISLFGMSVAAAELPEISRRSETQDAPEMAQRAAFALRQMAFLTVPTAVGYLSFGLLLVAALFRRGSFGATDSWLVYLVLFGYSLGLLASNASRVLSNIFYARGETRVPAGVAAVRVGFSTVVGIALMLALDRLSVSSLVGVPGTDRDLYLGAVGLAVAAGLASWLELWLLRRALGRRPLPIVYPVRAIATMAGLAVVAVIPAAAVWWVLPALPFPLLAAAVIGVYALTYLVTSLRWGVPEARAWLTRRARGGGRR